MAVATWMFMSLIWVMCPVIWSGAPLASSGLGHHHQTLVAPHGPWR